MRSLLIPFVSLALLQGTVTQAQPQWRFHLAFEDGAGARDTLWFIYDTTATLGWDTNPLVDEHLGEGAVEMDPDVFNVWTWNAQNDSTKSDAIPYTSYPYAATDIMGFNTTPPMVIRWDRTLFNSPDLPIAQEGPIGLAVLAAPYFFSTGQAGSDGAIDMLAEDSVVVQIPEYFFQMAVFHMSPGQLGYDPGGQLHYEFKLYPNPVTEVLSFVGTKPISGIRVVNAEGKEVHRHAEPIDGGQFTWDVSHLPGGNYTLLITTRHGTHHASFTKVDP